MIVESRAIRPDTGKDEKHFKKFFRRIIWNVLRYDQAFQKFAKNLYMSNVGNWSYFSEAMFDYFLQRRNIFIKEDSQVSLF